MNRKVGVLQTLFSGRFRTTKKPRAGDADLMPDPNRLTPCWSPGPHEGDARVHQRGQDGYINCTCIVRCPLKPRN